MCFAVQVMSTEASIVVRTCSEAFRSEDSFISHPFSALGVKLGPSEYSGFSFFVTLFWRSPAYMCGACFTSPRGPTHNRSPDSHIYNFQIRPLIDFVRGRFICGRFMLRFFIFSKIFHPTRFRLEYALKFGLVIKNYSLST